MLFPLVVSASLLFVGSASAQQCSPDVLFCPTGEQYFRSPSSNCQFPLCPSVCPDVNYKICPSINGAMHFTTRNPNNNCDFDACPRTGDCLQDVLQCADPYLNYHTARNPDDGCSWMPCPQTCTSELNECRQARDPFHNCQFPGCPAITASSVSCQSDVFECLTGEIFNRDPTNRCRFPRCPTDPSDMCSSDMLICPTGEIYNRDPYDNCEFPPCPVSCMEQGPSSGENFLRCSDGRWRTRDPSLNCNFSPCANVGDCTSDVQQCKNPYLNVYVARNPSKECSFMPCPQTCTMEVNACGQSRDPFNDCQFPGCPASVMEPGADNGDGGEIETLSENGEPVTLDQSEQPGKSQDNEPGDSISSETSESATGEKLHSDGQVVEEDRDQEEGSDHNDDTSFASYASFKTVGLLFIAHFILV